MITFEVYLALNDDQFLLLENKARREVKHGKATILNLKIRGAKFPADIRCRGELVRRTFD